MRFFAALIFFICATFSWARGDEGDGSLGTNLSARAHANVVVDIESDYWMRGKIADSRPYSSQYAELLFDLAPAGRIGGFVWSASSTSSGGQGYARRNFYNEVICTVFYGYEVKLSEGWGLDSVFYKQWVEAPGYSLDISSRSEFNFSQALNNPYLTPYYLMRRAVHGEKWCYWEVGVTRAWALTERLKFRATIFGEFGDDRHFLAQYGPEPNGGSYRHGLMALNAKARFDYALNDNVGLFAYVHQFNIVDSDARDAVGNSTQPNGRTDETIFGMGVTVQF